DEALQGAINPAPEQQEAQEEFATASRPRKPPARRQPQRPAAKTKSAPAAQREAAPLALTPRRPGAPSPKPEPRKTLSLGAQPAAPPGESCD
ncbi:hypothetical protein NQ256_24225, partial [Escherichia coli]|nr:hypothetical protein [Escherichia coli]